MSSLNLPIKNNLLKLKKKNKTPHATYRHEVKQNDRSREERKKVTEYKFLQKNKEGSIRQNTIQMPGMEHRRAVLLIQGTIYQENIMTTKFYVLQKNFKIMKLNYF